MLNANMVRSMACGLAGAAALTTVHELGRRMMRSAPRMDAYGKEGVARLFRGVGREVPPEGVLHRLALLGDLFTNATMYSRVAQGPVDEAWRRGALIGASAGLGAAALPQALGFDDEASSRSTATTLMTVAWYTLGGLAAAAAYRWFGRRED